MTLDESRKKMRLNCDVVDAPHHESLKQLIVFLQQSHREHQAEMRFCMEKLAEIASAIQQYDKKHRENFEKAMKNLEIIQRMASQTTR